MESFVKKIEIRWSDLDPNFHLRHSAYYDFGAFCRICFLSEMGVTPAVMLAQHVGPILFREECSFRKEIHFGDQISIDLQLERCNNHYSRWTMKHQIFRDETTLCASIIIDGAWIDTNLRKLTVPGSLFSDAIHAMPKSTTFLPPVG